MVYTGEGSLQYVDNYANGCTKHCSEWYCPLAACVPLGDILLGSGGGSDPTTIASLAKDVVSSKLGGLMVWFSSVIDAVTQESALVMLFKLFVFPSCACFRLGACRGGLSHLLLLARSTVPLMMLVMRATRVHSLLGQKPSRQ